eukprot:1189474-Prorocentrum_minimum.AAC.3
MGIYPAAGPVTAPQWEYTCNAVTLSVCARMVTRSAERTSSGSFPGPSFQAYSFGTPLKVTSRPIFQAYSVHTGSMTHVDVGVLEKRRAYEQGAFYARDRHGAAGESGPSFRPPCSRLFVRLFCPGSQHFRGIEYAESLGRAGGVHERETCVVQGTKQ